MGREIYMWLTPCAHEQIMTHRLYLSHFFLVVGGGIWVLFARLFLRYDFLHNYIDTLTEICLSPHFILFLNMISENKMKVSE